MDGGEFAASQLSEATGPRVWQPPCCGGHTLWWVYQSGAVHHHETDPWYQHLCSQSSQKLSWRAMEAAMGFFWLFFSWSWRQEASTCHPSLLSELFVKSIWGILARSIPSLPLYNPHVVIKRCTFSKLWIHYKYSHKVAAVFTFCELMQVENLSSEDQVWGNLLFMKSLLSNESVSNVDRWWNIHSLTADHIRVLLFVSFCFPTLICLCYSFPRSLTNTHQL